MSDCWHFLAEDPFPTDTEQLLNNFTPNTV